MQSLGSQQHEFLHHAPHDKGHSERPGHTSKDAETLDPDDSRIEQIAAEEHAGRQRSPSSSDSVHRDGAHRIVEF